MKSVEMVSDYHGILEKASPSAGRVDCPGERGLTGVRVSELCNMQVADVDVENFKIRINQGKGSKDRYVLFGKSFATALRTHIAAHPHNRWLFQTKRAGKYSTRRVQQIVKLYAEQAGVRATPHTFRHQAI